MSTQVYDSAERAFLFSAPLERDGCDVSSLVEVVPSSELGPDPRMPFLNHHHYRMSYRLTHLRHNVGVSAPIGILTSLTHWQVCWHDYVDPLAKASSFEGARAIASTLVLPPHTIDEQYRQLHVSDVSRKDDPRWKYMVRNCLKKVDCAPRCAPSERFWHLITPAATREGANGPKRNSLRLYDMVSVDDTQFYEVKFLGLSSDSMTCLVATETGACCVLKRPDKDSVRRLKWSSELSMEKEEMSIRAAAECSAWVFAYGDAVKVWVATLDGSPSLIMPFYLPLSDSDWTKSTTMPIVLRHVKMLADKGVRHVDVQRCHVAWSDRSRTDVVLLSWRSTSEQKVEDTRSVDDYLVAVLKQLRKK